ncbi:DEAD/DEAH box helicase [Corynebacterium lizhenjunii]|uniref:DEAD/DEAH box helicase n=1 Tax=Corynebacterium lizhenjunii TaxID=2709394 RepID=A0A7T0PAK1_9CORY|nr:DEAD/DEAH box helicase [Corynebacterium lizhenjunii]QPK79963.1 DEAD/DEAH box helicase [Corynebacterium lizhenjunii]
MSSFLIHGVWLPSAGLGVWIEQLEGHKIVTPAAVPQGYFPPALEKILKGKTFRNRARMSLRTPKGKDVTLMVPMALFDPLGMVETLQRTRESLSSPEVSAQQRQTLAPDLLWLAQAYAGLAQWVRAGRVTLRMNYQSGEWVPMWQLATGLAERGWLAEMIAAAPQVLTVNNGVLAEDMADELTHWIAFRELQELSTQPRPYPWHHFVDSILHTTAVRKGRAQLLRGLNEWRDSIMDVQLQLVFIVEEPGDEPQEPAVGVGAGAEGASASSDEGDMWPVRVCVRSGTDAPVPMRQTQLDHSSMERLRASQQRAIAISPLLDPNTYHPHPEEAYRMGDWDVYLTTDDLVRFVSTDTAQLQAAGFTVMLPKAWAHMSTTAQLEVREIDPAAAANAATHSHVGFEKLVAYDWKVSVGDTQLSDEEMEQLVASKSGLIKLRGQWVMADTSTLSKIGDYMEQLAAAARKQARARVEEALRRAEEARELGLPGWEERLERAQEAQQALLAYEDDDTQGVVSLAELRRLALESAVEQPVEFSGSAWHASLLGGMDSPSPQPVDIPPTVHAQLREYQHRGVDWLYWMSRNNLGAVLADDMGLGKTLQLLSLLAVEQELADSPGPTLVVAPTSVVGNWRREAARFVPHFKVIVHHGTQRPRGADFLKAVADADVVITSYGTATRDFAVLGAVEWEHVVLDEAQAIKNPGTHTSKAVRSLPARQRIALTGTPVENRLSEMRSIVDFCNPGVLGSASFFRNHFAKPIEGGQAPELAEHLRALVAPFILRRLKTDKSIIDDLPEKTEQVITVNLTSEQAALYRSLVDDITRRLESAEPMARRGLILASLTRIKQICNHPAHYLGDGSAVTLKGKHRSGKVAELIRIIDEAQQAGERLLIFTQYRAFGQLLVPYLSQHLGQEVPFLHGGVSKNKRDAMVEDFQRGDGPAAMVLSLKAGGTGLNLTAANIVVHMDRWWNPAVENQATDRAFRIGQQRNVQVYKMITAGTLEESIQDILDGKTKLAGAVVGEGEGWLTELNPDQLAELMHYRADAEEEA